MRRVASMPFFIRHLYVHEDYVRTDLGSLLYRLISGGRFAHDLHVGLRAKHCAQSFPNDTCGRQL